MQNKKFRLRNNLILNILFSFSSVTLALFGFLAVLPPASEPEVSAIIDGEQFALTVTNSDKLNLEINPTDSGTIAIAKDIIVANTNSPAGYKLYVSTDSESNAIHLNGKESNNTEDKKLVPTTGTNELPTQLENNSWGFAIAGAANFDANYSTESPSTTSKFAAVPQKDAEQLIHDHTGRATDDETEIYFAAKADTSIASGNYQTTILYTTLSEATDQDTTEINVENTVFPTNYETIVNKTVVMNTSIVSSKIPTVMVKVGTVQAENVTITNNAPLSLTFNLPAGLAEGTHDVTLYITNLAKSYTKQNAIGIYEPMQEMTPEFCESMTLEEQKQFLDTRDNKVYFAAKLKDGNCWMTQNLDYDLSVAENQTLTPATSNVTENRTVVPANTDLATWLADHNAIYYLDGGDTYYANGTTKTEGYSSLPEDSIDRHYAQGDYYSWKAATAGQGTTDITDADVNESICPAGWRLPTSNSADANYSFGNLVKQYGYTGSNQSSTSDATLLASPLFFARGGRVGSGSLLNQGSYGFYWSSRAYSSSNGAYYLGFGSSVVYPSSLINDRNYGYSVRCVAKGTPQTLTLKDNITEETISTNNFEVSFNLPEAPAKEGYNFLGYDENKTATTPTYNPGDLIDQPKTLYAIYEEATLYMQDVANWKNKLELEQQVQVVDKRDNKTYWVSKLKDGNIWMTQNLDYDLSVAANQTLTPSTSNVTTTRTVTPVSWGTDYNSIYYLDGGDVYYANGTTKTEGYSSLPEDSIDRHYAQGDYYSWKAATAGQGTTSITNADVNESICPAGWRLPTSNSDSANYSFGNLVKQYGYTGNNQSGTTDATLLASPLFFARGGGVRSGSLYDQGSYGYYWSSRARSNGGYAYRLNFYSSGVNPSGSSVRNYGFSVRCVAL